VLRSNGLDEQIKGFQSVLAHLEQEFSRILSPTAEGQPPTTDDDVQGRFRYFRSRLIKRLHSALALLDQELFSTLPPAAEDRPPTIEDHLHDLVVDFGLMLIQVGGSKSATDGIDWQVYIASQLPWLFAAAHRRELNISDDELSLMNHAAELKEKQKLAGQKAAEAKVQASAVRAEEAYPIWKGYMDAIGKVTQADRKTAEKGIAAEKTIRRWRNVFGWENRWKEGT